MVHTDRSFTVVPQDTAQLPTHVPAETCGLAFMFVHTVIITPVTHTLMSLYLHDIYVDSCNEYQYL